MKTILQDILNLFYPPVCATCGRALPENAKFMCNYCRWEMPLTEFWKSENNPMAEMLREHLPVENASSYIYFVHGSNFRNVIHQLKYQGSWRYAKVLGEWFGAELRDSPLYADIDIVVPVPLHLRKRLARGYNQAEYMARGIASAMNLAVDTRSVERHRYNRSQTKHGKDERWENVRGIFRVRDTEALHGKHILLVDDVLTTGATILSCGEEILRAIPDCRLSIATIATPRNDNSVKG